MALQADVETPARRSSLAFIDPCGWWQDSQPSTRRGGCSNTNGPRLSAWHLMHGGIVDDGLFGHAGPLPMRQVGERRRAGYDSPSIA